MTEPADVPAADPAARLVDADREAALAKRRLTATLGALQTRLRPQRLADKASRRLRVAGEASADAATRNRGALVGVGAALALFLVRKPLGRLLRRRPADPATPADAPR